MYSGPVAPKAEASPPRFLLQLAGHPLRWQLLSELAGSDRRVGELCERAGVRQSLVSYHLRRLRDGGLVSARRSLADRRDTYYVLELARCGELLAGAGASLHPGLALTRSGPAGGRARARVLFLCTGNSARSQMAEALPSTFPRRRCVPQRGQPSKGRCIPTRCASCAERGIDISGERAKHVSEFAGERFDHVITLCDRVREVCPEFPARPRRSTGASPTRPRATTSQLPRLRAHRRRARAAHRLSARPTTEPPRRTTCRRDRQRPLHGRRRRSRHRLLHDPSRLRGLGPLRPRSQTSPGATCGC